jgi:hypothetical protein
LPHRYNYIDDALKLTNHTFYFNEGLSYVDTSERYGYSYETIVSIAKDFEENAQLVLPGIPWGT